MAFKLKIWDILVRLSNRVHQINSLLVMLSTRAHGPVIINYLKSKKKTANNRLHSMTDPSSTRAMVIKTIKIWIFCFYTWILKNLYILDLEIWLLFKLICVVKFLLNLFFFSNMKIIIDKENIIIHLNNNFFRLKINFSNFFISWDRLGWYYILFTFMSWLFHFSKIL